MEFLSLELLNQYRSVILVGMSVVYAIATLLLWFFTSRSNLLARLTLEEMKRNYEEEVRPYVGLHPEINAQGWFLLTLKNYGRTPAFQVQLTFTKNYIARKEQKETLLISDLGICERLPLLGAGAHLTEIIHFQSHRFWELNVGQQTLKGALTYADDQGKLYREEILYDLNPLFNRRYIVYPSLQTALQTVESNCQKLNRQLEFLNR